MKRKGPPNPFAKLRRTLRDLPVLAAQRVAAAVAPRLTALAAASYDGGLTVYGDARPVGVQGNALDLVQSGSTRGHVRFVAVGTRVRAALGTRYAKYLIGKYRILPMGRPPAAWTTEIDRTVARELAAITGGAS